MYFSPTSIDPFPLNASPLKSVRISPSLSLSLSTLLSVNTSWWPSSLGHALQCERLVLNTNQSKQGQCVCVCVCVCFICVCEVGRGRVPRKKNTTIESWVVSSQPNHIYDSQPSLFLLSLFMFLCLSLPRSPFLLTVLWFNCHGQRTYGQWAAARNFFFYSTADLPNERGK